MMHRHFAVVKKVPLLAQQLESRQTFAGIGDAPFEVGAPELSLPSATASCSPPVEPDDRSRANDTNLGIFVDQRQPLRVSAGRVGEQGRQILERRSPMASTGNASWRRSIFMVSSVGLVLR